jgi:hypothetical protein
MTDTPATREAPPATDAPPIIQLPPPRPKGRGGVRRKAINPRVARTEIRTTLAGKAELRAAAKAAGMTVTDYLLAHLPGSRAPKPQAFTADPLILVRMLGELGKWGGNWNQLAHRRNQTGEEPELAELRRIADALWDMRCEVLRALKRER